MKRLEKNDFEQLEIINKEDGNRDIIIKERNSQLSIYNLNQQNT